MGHILAGVHPIDHGSGILWRTCPRSGGSSCRFPASPSGHKCITTRDDHGMCSLLVVRAVVFPLWIAHRSLLLCPCWGRLLVPLLGRLNSHLDPRPVQGSRGSCEGLINHGPVTGPFRAFIKGALGYHRRVILGEHPNTRSEGLQQSVKAFLCGGGVPPCI